MQSLVWAVTYKPLEQGSCPAKAGEQLGIQKFSTPSGDEQLSIKPATLVALDERDPDSLAYSLGALAKESDAEGFCSADVAVAEKHAPAVDAEDLPPKNIVYRWSNVRILATPQAPGTQMVAEPGVHGGRVHREVRGLGHVARRRGLRGRGRQREQRAVRAGGHHQPGLRHRLRSHPDEVRPGEAAALAQVSGRAVR